MAIVKSELIKQLKRSYPNFLTRDLTKVTEIILKEIKNSLDRNEGIELRGFGTFFTKKISEKHAARNPKTGELIYVPEKNKVRFRPSKKLEKFINK